MPNEDEQRVVDAYPAMRRFAFAVADLDCDPDDLLHEALVRVLDRKPIGEIDNLTAYVCRAITNVASNRRRSLGRRRRAIDRLAAGSDDETSTPAVPSDLAELMMLDPPKRAALYLFVVEGYSHRQVAEALDITVVAARSRVSKALKLLRADMAEEVQAFDVG